MPDDKEVDIITLTLYTLSRVWLSHSHCMRSGIVTFCSSVRPIPGESSHRRFGLVDISQSSSIGVQRTDCIMERPIRSISGRLAGVSSHLSLPLHKPAQQSSEHIARRRHGS